MPTWAGGTGTDTGTGTVGLALASGLQCQPGLGAAGSEGGPSWLLPVQPDPATFVLLRARFPVYLALRGAAVKDSGERRRVQSPGLGSGVGVRATAPSVPFPLDTDFWEAGLRKAERLPLPALPQPPPDDLAVRP